MCSLPVTAFDPALRSSTSRRSNARGAAFAPQTGATDLLHSFCTNLAQAGTPDSTMLDIMGQVSAASLGLSHVRVQARRDAIAAVEARSLANGVPKNPCK
jgi:hypothetical protein